MKLFVYSFLFLSLPCFSQTKILFDASRAQMCSNADWVIDADQNNIGNGTNGVMAVGQGNEANPQRYPSPAQSGITQNTAETYWDGALSAWAVDLVKLGYQVETLPYNGTITYGNANNPQDLSNYKVFISDEPNIKFLAAEKDAIIHFVQNGGGLFMIADHTISDRNFDGWDSPRVWNNLMDTNNIQNGAFGMKFDIVDISQTSSNIANLANDSCLHNSLIGNVTQLKISGGTTITLNHSQNATSKGLIYKTGASNTGTTQIFLASARFGNGTVAALTDSSPPDDGTGDANDNLFFSYTGEANGSHRIMLLNTTVWLAATQADTVATAVNEIETPKPGLRLFPNPVKNELTVQTGADFTGDEVSVFDVSGRKIAGSVISAATFTLPTQSLLPGVYLVKVRNETKRFTKVD